MCESIVSVGPRRRRGGPSTPRTATASGASASPFSSSPKRRTRPRRRCAAPTSRFPRWRRPTARWSTRHGGSGASSTASTSTAWRSGTTRSSPTSPSRGSRGSSEWTWCASGSSADARRRLEPLLHRDGLGDRLPRPGALRPLRGRLAERRPHRRRRGLPQPPRAAPRLRRAPAARRRAAGDPARGARRALLPAHPARPRRGGAAWCSAGATPEEERFFTPCAHSDPVSRTTASLVAPLPDDRAGPWPVWISFGSPCTGVFLPVYRSPRGGHQRARRQAVAFACSRASL
jgi:hypothetical protein